MTGNAQLADAPRATRPSTAGRTIWRLQRNEVPARAVHRVVAGVLGLLVCLVYLMLQPGVGGSLWSTIWVSTFGSWTSTNLLLLAGIPLVLAAASNAIALRAGIWNLGVEGQFYMGAWAATAIAFALPDLPTLPLIVLMLAGAVLGGLVWAATPALLRAYLGVSEIFTTLMLSFVAVLWVTYFAAHPWAKGGVSISVAARPLPEGVRLPDIGIGQLQVNVGLLIALGAVACLWVLFRGTRFGYHTQLVGSSEGAARYAGVDVKRLLASVLLLSGAVGGLAGAVTQLSTGQALGTTLSGGAGFTGLVVAILAGCSFLGVVPVALLLAAVMACQAALSISGVEPDAFLLLTGVLLLFGGLSGVMARYKVVRVTVPPAPAQPEGAAR